MMNIPIVLCMYCKTQIVVDHHLQKYDEKNSTMRLILMFSCSKRILVMDHRLLLIFQVLFFVKTVLLIMFLLFLKNTYKETDPMTI